MKKEEKKAIEYCKYIIDLADRLDEVIINLRKEPVNKLLNLIETQKAIINLMAEQLTTPINDKKWVIEYYTKLAEEEK